MLQKQACQHESKLHVAKFKTCMLQQAACQHQLKLHVAKKSMSTWIQHACCTIQDMHVAPIKTKKIMLLLHVRTCQGQRGLFIGTPSVTHTLTRCGGESSSKSTRFLVTWFLHVNMHTVLYMLLVVIFLHVDCTCCMLWFLHVDVVCKKKFHEQTYVCMYWTGAGLNQICRQSTPAGSIACGLPTGGAARRPHRAVEAHDGNDPPLSPAHVRNVPRRLW